MKDLCVVKIQRTTPELTDNERWNISRWLRGLAADIEQNSKPEGTEFHLGVG